jgi:hypothetical protein
MSDRTTRTTETADVTDFDRLVATHAQEPLTLAHFAAFFQIFRQHVKRYNEHIRTLEAKVAELDARGPAMKFAGTWVDKSGGYALGETVTRQGSLWHSDVSYNRSIPGLEGSAWTLCVKHGRNGKDARE